MSLGIAEISPYLTALIVAVGALFVGALNQRHRTLEKRLDDLYSKIYPYVATKDKASLSLMGHSVLPILFEKNYLMSPDLLYLYSGYVLPTVLRGDDVNALHGREDEFIRIVRRDYEEYRDQYLSFRKMLVAMFGADKLSAPGHARPP
jgi:hypothetical protein